MTEAAPIVSETRLARRIARLFRIETGGRFQRRPTAAIERLIKRRGALISDLLALDRRRRSRGVAHSPELTDALAELMKEVNRALRPARTRADRIATELHLLLGKALPSGVRDSGNGQFLGSS